MLLALLLVTVASWVDAVGFLRLGGLFVSFMSGNSTKAAVSASIGEMAKAAQLATVAIGFAAAVFAGELAGLASGPLRVPVLLAAEALLLGVAWFGRGDAAVMTAALVAAMGWQNAALPRGARFKPGLTYVTGALVHLGQSAARACAGQAPWADAGRHAALWAALVLGGLAGALGDRVWASGVLLVPTAVLAMLALVCACTAAIGRSVLG